MVQLVGHHFLDMSQTHIKAESKPTPSGSRNNMELCLCPGLQSTMDEEIEEGGPTSKTALSGEHGRRSKAKR